MLLTICGHAPQGQAPAAPAEPAEQREPPSQQLSSVSLNGHAASSTPVDAPDRGPKQPASAASPSQADPAAEPAQSSAAYQMPPPKQKQKPEQEQKQLPMDPDSVVQRALFASLAGVQVGHGNVVCLLHA